MGANLQQFRREQYCYLLVTGRHSVGTWAPEGSGGGNNSHTAREVPQSTCQLSWENQIQIHVMMYRRQTVSFRHTHGHWNNEHGYNTITPSSLLRAPMYIPKYFLKVVKLLIDVGFDAHPWGQ